ncbi:MAG TPA: DNA-3-methyladenine glycosylase 2 family protein [Rhodocyclaceae bacterium]
MTKRQGGAALPDFWAEASRVLAANDPVMASMVKRYQGRGLASRGDPFATLMRSVVGQQISVRAADAVWGRLMEALGAPDAEAVLGSDATILRACGLSYRKIEYVQDLAGRFADGRIDPTRWRGLADSEIIAELTETRGIGAWTVEMLLIFNLMRPDVWPVDDKGLQKAVALHYLDGRVPPRKELLAIGERWRPWRSVATWYLWRSLDPVPVEY